MEYKSKVSLKILDLISEMELVSKEVKVVVVNHTDYVLNDHELNSVLSGSICLPLAMKLLVVKALEDELKDQESKQVKLDHPDIISVSEINLHSEDRTMIYTVLANSAEDAIKKLSCYGVRVQGYRNTTDYDCSGKWCASALTTRDAINIPYSDLWVLRHAWSLDV